MIAGGFERYAQQFMQPTLSAQDRLKLATGVHCGCYVCRVGRTLLKQCRGRTVESEQCPRRRVTMRRCDRGDGSRSRRRSQ